MPGTLRRFDRRAAALLLVVGASSGCGDAASPTPSAGGTWALASVNGAPLPLTAYRGAESSIDILADTVVLAPDGAASDAGADRYTRVDGRSDTTVSRSSGRWRQQGQTVLLSWGPGATRDSVAQTATLTRDGQLAAVCYAGSYAYSVGAPCLADPSPPALRWARVR